MVGLRSIISVLGKNNGGEGLLVLNSIVLVAQFKHMVWWATMGKHQRNNQSQGCSKHVHTMPYLALFVIEIHTSILM